MTANDPSITPTADSDPAVPAPGAPASVPAAVDPTASTTDPATGPEGAADGVAEAIKYRRRLRESEAGREADRAAHTAETTAMRAAHTAETGAMRAVLETFQRAEIERLAEGVIPRPADAQPRTVLGGEDPGSAWLADPAAIWDGAQLSDFLADDGAVDRARVVERMRQLGRERPDLVTRTPRTRNPFAPLRPGASTGDTGATTWADVLRG